jgi:hypothetical protein
MRIVAVSDLHTHLPEVPPCDLLLIGEPVPSNREGSTEAYDLRPHPRGLWNLGTRRGDRAGERVLGK